MDARTLEKKMKFIEDYKNPFVSINAATASKYDSNANVTIRNIATLQCELGKKDIIDVKRKIIYDYIIRDFNIDIADQYLIDLKKHIIYANDETSLFPYCCSVSLYPFLMSGLLELGGTSLPPQHTDSFIGGIINLIFLIVGQFSGACAIPEWLTYFDHFLRKDFGENYIQNLNNIVIKYENREETIKNKIENWFQQFVYSINQPAGARNYQSPFINIAYFDKYYFEYMFKDFVFPDGDKPKWETTKELQKLFMKWFNKERTKCVITFPVESFNALVENNKYKDEEMADFAAEMWSEGHSFFMYQSSSVDALASCCRLRNALEDNVFSYTLGAGGIETGSKGVVTLNINRIVQDWYNNKEIHKETLADYLGHIVDRVHIYLQAWNNKLWDDYNAGILTIYKAGFIHLDKQFLTIGVNGFIEGAEFLNINIDPECTEYKQFAHDILGTIKHKNTLARTKKCKYNTEMIPAESTGLKLYNWDKKDGYKVPEHRNLYNSYFYKVEDTTIDPVKKFYYQGDGFASECDGGVALHNNLTEHLSKKQYRMLMDVAIDAGCNYFTFNIPSTCCEDCGYVSKHNLDHCEKCNSKNITKATRIIGYLKKTTSWSEGRQIEYTKRYFGDLDD